VDILSASLSEIELMYDKALSKMNNSSTTESSTTSVQGSPVGKQYKRKSTNFLSKFPWLELISYSSHFIVVSLAKAVSVQSNQVTPYTAFSFLYVKLDCFFKKNKKENVSLTLSEYIIKTENNEEDVSFIKTILVR
jgi:hypothetical protein